MPPKPRAASVIVPVPVICDSREQRPYEFTDALTDGSITLARAALPAGDYSLVGFTDRVAIERKSLADYVATVIHARERFAHELRTLARYDLGAVVVEATLEDVLEHRYATAAAPESVWGATMSVIVDYGVPVYWCGSRGIACRLTLDLLKRWWISHRRAMRTLDVPESGQTT